MGKYKEQKSFYEQKLERLKSLGYTCIHDGGMSFLTPKDLDQYFELLQRTPTSYITHNLRVLTSDMSLDEIFQECFGWSRKEKYERDSQNNSIRNAEEEREKQERSSKVPIWMARGKSLLYPELHEEWETRVNRARDSKMEEMIIEDVLDILSSIDSKGDFTEAREKLDQIREDSVNVAEYIRTAILLLSKHGPDFYENTAEDELSDEIKAKIVRIRAENETYKQAEQKRKVEEQR